jgi:two-component system response regulator MprA
MTTILVVDDDHKITDMLRRTLAYEGFRVVVGYDGQEALNKAQIERPDLVVLDWLMPKLNGIETAKLLHAASNVPILMLTARDTVEQRVEGLNSGADDYLVKPFAPEELLARIRALLRRADTSDKDKTLTYADLALDVLTRETRRGDRLFNLTPKNLNCFTTSCAMRQVLNRDRLCRTWGYDFEAAARAECTSATCATKPKQATNRA